MIQSPVSVLHLISSLQVGGAERLLVDFIEATIPDDRINVIVVVMNQAIHPDLQQRLERTGVTVYYLNRPEGHLHYQYLIELRRIIHRHQVAVVHTHNSGSKLWSVLCKLLCPYLKLVFTVHDTVPRHYSWLQKCLHGLMIDEHIAISQAVHALCKREKLLPVRLIYNGVPLQDFHLPGKLSWQQRLAKATFKESPLRIIQVSRLQHGKKGQDLLLTAVRQCLDHGLNVHLTLMGGVQEYNQESYEFLQTLVEKLDLKDHVQFRVNQTDVLAQFEQAELFILPSRYEGFGLVLLEAMSAELPVIASRIEGPSELIMHNETGLLFDVNSSQSLFEAIRHLYEQPLEADRLAKNALAATANFDIQRLKLAYYELYEDLTRPEVTELPMIETAPRILNGDFAR